MSKKNGTGPNTEDTPPSESFQRKVRNLYSLTYIWINRTRHASRKNSVPGRVFYYTAMRFNKTVISIAGQIQLLESSRLLYEDKGSALHFLSTISLRTFYTVFSCLYYLLLTNSPLNQFKDRFKKLIGIYPNLNSLSRPQDEVQNQKGWGKEVAVLHVGKRTALTLILPIGITMWQVLPKIERI